MANVTILAADESATWIKRSSQKYDLIVPRHTQNSVTYLVYLLFYQLSLYAGAFMHWHPSIALRHSAYAHCSYVRLKYKSTLYVSTCLQSSERIRNHFTNQENASYNAFCAAQSIKLSVKKCRCQRPRAL
ncbi:hypothetical protein BCR43DRAFT_496190 [Syncephalastrum racemosum]|uniref:Uncharacterized protein n=1 Tax=Syncephalastrum racemosum TaxID=13706 RepID=A0A1X2H3N2_SYNRA|nr:hypothetical protein BCR43DRAFT_496190 [Syncephalastrum racemosum]